MAKRTPKSSVPLTAPELPPALIPLIAVAHSGAKSPPQAPTSTGETMDIDDTIGQVTQLYRAITGRDVPASNTPYAPIPADMDPVQHVQQQLERLRDALTSPVGRASATPWAPAFSIYETPVELLVTIDVPGTTRDALEVKTERGLLVVSGQRNPSALGNSTMRHTENSFGPFRRVIPLPPGFRTTDMKAHVESGVLHVQIPRDSDAGARHVTVEY
jgi:HSP20 family protein